jgi:phosphoribosylformylglycinamidine synthase
MSVNGQRFKALVKVGLKRSVLDPQGKTVLHALHSLGFEEAKDLRVGKSFEIVLEGRDQKTVEDRVRQFCEKLLVNPVIEEYSFTVTPV